MNGKYRSTKFSCFTGYVSQAITVNLAPLLFVIFSDTFRLSLAFIAILPLLTFLIQILIDFAAIWFIEKFNFRFLSFLSQFTSFLGLLLLALLPSVMDPAAAIIIAILVYSSGSALAEVILSPLIDALDREGSGTPMTFLHSFYSWGQVLVILVTTFILKAIGGSHWNVLPLLWAVVPLVNTVLFLRVPMPRVQTHDNEHGITRMLLTPSFIIAFILMICAGATEQVMAQWASLFAEVGLGVSKVIGDVAGPCLFAFMMGIGRTLHGFFGEKLDMKKLLMTLSAFTVLCYGVTIFAPVPFIALVGCGLSGIGVSIMWPGMLNMCSDDYPGAGASMFALLALGGDIGCSVGPYLSGIVSDAVTGAEFTPDVSASLGLLPEQLGLRAGFLAAVIFPLFMFIGTFLLNREVSHAKIKRLRK